MKVTVDTNILVRTVVEDDAEQAGAARALLARATLIAVPIPVFCELAWVLKRAYGHGANDIAAAIEASRLRNFWGLLLGAVLDSPGEPHLLRIADWVPAVEDWRHAERWK